MANAVECTAAAHARDPLMTPPCACPRCAAPVAEAEAARRATIWLAVGGRPVRHDVENLELGTTGRSLLG